MEALVQIKRFICIVLFSFYSQWVLASLPIQFWQTSSGTRVYFVENHDLPMLDINVEFAAGSAMDTASKSVLAQAAYLKTKLPQRWPMLARN